VRRALTRGHGAAARLGARPGVTLIEIMVATVILSMVSAMIWVSFDQGARATRQVEASQNQYHEAQVALSVISRDLSSAFLSKHVNPAEPTAEYVFIGENESRVDRLDFVSFSHRRTVRDSHESDQCEIGYYGSSDLEDASITNLVRRESPIIDDEPLEGGKRQVLVHDVLEFDVTYYDRDQDEWVELWDTTQATSGHPDRLPDQVRVLLTVRESGDQELTFTTQFPIHLHEALLFGRREM
jgi:general secretion pathway protein J